MGPTFLFRARKKEHGVNKTAIKDYAYLGSYNSCDAKIFKDRTIQNSETFEPFSGFKFLITLT